MRISDWSSDVGSSDLPRVLVVGLGDKAKFAVPQYLKSVADAARALKCGAGASVLFTLSELEVAGRDNAWNIRQAVISASHSSYRYTATLCDNNKSIHYSRFLLSVVLSSLLHSLFLF